MATSLAPSGGLTDDQLLAMPAAGGSTPQLTDDQLLAMPAAGGASSPSQPGLASRLVGIGERGMVGGALGIAGAAQSAGRWLDNRTQGILPALSTPSADNVDLQSIGDRALDADHAYKPQEASGKLLQGAISGATGAVLTGGAGLLPMAAGTAAGIAAPAARALGASDDTADDIALGVGMLPFGGAAAVAGGRAAAGAVRSNLVGRAAARITNDQAVQTVLMDDAVRQYAASVPSDGSLSQMAASYKKDLNTAVENYGASAQGAGLVNPQQANSLDNARSQANSHTNGLPTAPGSAMSEVQGFGLPDSHQQALEGGLGLLNAASGQQFGVNATGPMTVAAQKLAPLAGYGGALGTAYSGHPIAALGAAVGTYVGSHATPWLMRAGQIGDRLVGTDVPQFAWNADAARRAVADRGLTVPSQDPLLALQDATSANNQLISDRAAAASAQNAADKQYLYDFADAQHMNRQFDLSANQQRAYEVSDAAAMDRQRTAGMNNADGAGNWMERQLLSKFKQSNPGVPVTGAAAVGSSGPQGLFEATGGKYGSPVDPSDPMANGLVTAPGQAAPQAPSPAPQPPAGGPTAPPATPPSDISPTGPYNPMAAPRGGQVQANQMLLDQTGRSATTDELHRAAYAVLPPQDAFTFTSGVNTHRDVSYQVAQHVAQQRAAQIPAQATNEVSSLMGTQSLLPNGGDRGPIGSLPRWQSAANTYQQHAAQMGAVAPDQATKIAVSQVAAVPRTADKQAILDAFKASNPGASTAVFTPQLMKGV